MFIYVIGAKDKTGPMKIGITGNLVSRLSNIQTGNPIRLKIHHSEEVPDDRCKVIEQLIHKEISYKKKSGEWFNVSIEEAIDEVKFAVLRYVDDPLY